MHDLLKYPFCSFVLLVALFLTGCAITDVTSSTSDTVDTVTPDITLNRFVDVRLASIQKEAALGEGENLDALAELLGKKDKRAFSFWVQSNYDFLFADLKTPSQFVSRIKNQAGMNKPTS